MFLSPWPKNIMTVLTDEIKPITTAKCQCASIGKEGKVTEQVMEFNYIETIISSNKILYHNVNDKHKKRISEYRQ